MEPEPAVVARDGSRGAGDEPAVGSGGGSWRDEPGALAKIRRRARVLGWVIRVLLWTMRYTRQPASDVAGIAPAGKGRIVVLFHGEHPTVLGAYSGKNTTVITSQSKDGELLTRILEGFGYDTVRGSSTRGAVSALAALARKVKGGGDVVIAVDGPKGPRNEVKAGALLLAKLTGSPVVPVYGAPSRSWRFEKSWDRMRLPKPGAAVLTVLGDPVWVPRGVDDAELEALRLGLEEQMQRQQAAVDEAVTSRAGRRALLAERREAMRGVLSEATDERSSSAIGSGS
ncbi:MAG: lysophospholipid acyltransferase family protein [Planctomycetota bacterium]